MNENVRIFLRRGALRRRCRLTFLGLGRHDWRFLGRHTQTANLPVVGEVSGVTLRYECVRCGLRQTLDLCGRTAAWLLNVDLPRVEGKEAGA